RIFPLLHVFVRRCRKGSSVQDTRSLFMRVSVILSDASLSRASQPTEGREGERGGREGIDQLTHSVYLFTKRPLKCAVGKKFRRMAGPPSPPARKPRSGLVFTPSWKAPPDLAPFLLTSCQVRVASRETQFESVACETDNSLKDLGQRWKLRGPHIFD
ncbi:hypothetical protein ALC53_13190, partial [Atta colombica]